MPPKEKASEPYGIQYYKKACEIWNRESTIELPFIAKAAEMAYRSLKNGGRLYCQIVGGHMHLAELRPRRPGNPNYLPNWNRHKSEEAFADIDKGDFILFDYPKEHIRRAHDCGAFTVGIRTPYFPNKTTPKGVLAINDLLANPLFKDVILTEECADLLFTPGVPFTDGVLFIPEIPAVRPCPISPQGTFNFYWMLTAEIAMRDKGSGGNGTSEKACEYIELIKQRGSKIRADFDIIDNVAKAMVDYVSRGARYCNYIYGGKSQIMATENIYRTSGLVMSRLLIGPKDIVTNGKAGDFVIIAGEASDVKENIEASKAFKNAGIKVIYIGPRTDGSSGYDMLKIADWHIDTYSPERDGALTVPGFNNKICPTTGVLYALCQYILNAQFIEYMIEADMIPSIYMGIHLIGGKDYNKRMQQIWEKKGY